MKKPGQETGFGGLWGSRFPFGGPHSFGGSPETDPPYGTHAGLFQLMPHWRLGPNLMSHNLSISALAKVGKWQHALGLLMALKDTEAASGGDPRIQPKTSEGDL